MENGEGTKKQGALESVVAQKQSKALGGSKLDYNAGEDLKLHFLRSGLGAEPS